MRKNNIAVLSRYERLAEIASLSEDESSALLQTAEANFQEKIGPHEKLHVEEIAHNVGLAEAVIERLESASQLERITSLGMEQAKILLDQKIGLRELSEQDPEAIYDCLGQAGKMMEKARMLDAIGEWAIEATQRLLDDGRKEILAPPKEFPVLEPLERLKTSLLSWKVNKTGMTWPGHIMLSIKIFPH
jgi:hypothetical protein